MSKTPESLISIATATFYKNWHPYTPELSPDKVRGDLAIQFAKTAVDKGFSVTVVDAGSPSTFKENLEQVGAHVYTEVDRGMSGSRRQALTEASRVPGSKVLAWIEPEKVSLVRDALPQAAEPLLQGKADIVVPARNDQAFATYPFQQAAFEFRSASCF